MENTKKSIPNRVQSMIERLDDDEAITKKECETIQIELDELKEVRNEKLREFAMNNKIDDLLKDFNRSTDESKVFLNSILETVTEGKVPDSSTIQELNFTIEDLRNRYEAIQYHAENLLPNEELPEEGASVHDYVDAINNSRTLLYKKQLEELKSLLEKFVSVKSLVERYAEALVPFQEKAKTLLHDISDESMSVENAIEESSNVALFMDAFECKNFEDERGEELLQQVAENMNFKVQRGLATKSYEIDSSVKINMDKSVVIPKDDVSIAVKEPIEKTTIAADGEKCKEDDEVNTEEETQLSETKEEKEQIEESDFVKQVKASDLILSNDEIFGKLVEDISPNEDKKLTATIFTNDLRKGNVKAAINVIKALCINVGLTESALAEAIRIRSDLLSNNLSHLMKKGYIRRYAIKQGEVVFPSPRLKTALTYKSASSFVKVKQNCLKNYEWDQLNNNHVASVIAYSNILQRIMEEPESKRIHESAFDKKGSFILQVFGKSVRKSSVAMGSFWSDIDSCNFYATHIENLFNICKKAEEVIFAAFDFQKASQFARILIECCNIDSCDADFRLYSLEENEFKNYEAGDALETVEIEIPEIAEIDNEDSNKGNVKKTEIEAICAQDEMDGIEEMLIDRQFYAATAYAKAEAAENPEKKGIYNQLKYAFDDPSAKCNYTAENLFSLMSSNDDLENALVVSAALRTFFSNQVKYDYDIKSVYNALNDYELLESIDSLRQILYDMSEFKATYNTGLDYYADYHKRDQKALDEEIKELQKEAEEFYNKNVVGIIKEKTAHRRFMETTKRIFSADSELGQSLKFVMDGEIEAKDLILESIREKFYSPESIVAENTIDDGMLWNYIQEFWDEAGKKMTFRKRDDLKSHLRNNITNKTTKAVQILAKWCTLVDMMGDHEDDDGAIAYKKLRNSLLANLSCAIESTVCEEKKEVYTKSQVAGMKVLENTLVELKACIEGTYDESARKYFYKNFLLTDYVMLDEKYLPDVDTPSSALDALSMQTRIKKHLSEVKKNHPTFETHLTEILEDQGDDLGSARLIVNYLNKNNLDANYDKYVSEIGDSIAYAKETAELRKADFIGELELAQSYGQIDNSTEDQKEIILKTVDEWFEWADLSKNYGFFKKVIDEYMADIRKNATNREKDILEELEEFRTSANSDLSVEDKERKIEKVRKALKEQNYTVAEDILSRDDFDDNNESLIEEDFLKDFLDNYDDFYFPVSAGNQSLANLIKKRTRNKEERGGKRLAENWLPGGSELGKTKLEALLKNLGFDVEDIVEQRSVGHYEEYKVRTVGAFKRQRNSYTHPIAAFGSGAAEAGFRVVCCNGSFDADKLIDVMKQFGTAKHTLILLDWALTMNERRRLARKTKTSLGDKLFAVLDRTVMMYLIRNYDETKINRMLVALVTPFAYYQPYVWESANVMPPEIFMGRKVELEKIKSPTGVNIVYGGRQLGKSALLKKAKEDIDWNENGDRAIYIDIKGLDYKATARKISHELVDQFVLKENLDTDNWDDLARAVRRRLQNNDDRIPYLLLLLDEADAFIESCSEINYSPFDSLKEIQSVGVGRFKFVVAGLRDIVRFKRDALANNSVLTHLEPMTVTPFKFTEARELMEIPLYYLGLRFPKEKESLITLIMATTNYFPGLIQLYCAKLIDAMRNKDYAGYDESDTPIYEVSEEHIKKVLSDPEFMQQIREKYIITLKLDEDNYYHLIALILAWLYHNEGEKSGYSAEDIQRIGVEYGIKKLVELESFKLENLCEELKELNVLRKTDEHKYKFTRFTFFQMMGTADEIDTSLLEYMEE